MPYISARVRQDTVSDRRYVDVDASDRVHVLPSGTVRVHTLSAACWCEPEPSTWVPDDSFKGECYPAWWHHTIS